MCGIIGQIKFKEIDISKPDLSKLDHRGPDGSGEWVNNEGNVYFGHTRLAILEPTIAGKQPMLSSNKKFALTFNGEIYNHLELRMLLPEINWNGNSDTETLLELISSKGITALSLLKGMFAFALYDFKERSVLLVRDRIGIKPLYIRSEEFYTEFSSEIRPLLRVDDPKFRKNAISEYVAFGRFPENSDLFLNIRALEPGTYMKIESNGNVNEKKWWSPLLISRKVYNNKKILKPVEEIKKLVTDSVEQHLISDVGVGAFLSGGIDSSIISLVAGRTLGKNLQTFTIGFSNNSFDERQIAGIVAKRAGSTHTELEINENDCLTWVQEAVCKMDLPSIDAINTYIVSKAVRQKGLKVALSGMGGDELFGGYPSFSKVPVLSKYNFLPTIVQKNIIKNLPIKYKQKLEGVRNFSSPELTMAYRRFTGVEDLKKMGLNSGIPNVPVLNNSLDTMAKISWTEINGYMIPMLLRDSDQMSMAVGLEIRVPFLDHILVQEVLNLPQSHKKGRGMKSLLVDAFKLELPEAVYNRPKQGFLLPMNDWLRGPLEEFAINGLNSASKYLDNYEPLYQMKKFLKGEIHWTRIWHYSVLGHWLDNRKTDIGKNAISRTGLLQKV